MATKKKPLNRRPAKRSNCNCKGKKKRPELQVFHHMVKVCDWNNVKFRKNLSEFMHDMARRGYRQYIHWVPMENTMISGSSISASMIKLIKEIGYDKVSLLIGHPVPPPKCSPGNPNCGQG